MVINTGKVPSWDSTINQATLAYFVTNTSHCVNCKVSGDNQLAGTADWGESFNNSLGDYIQPIFTDCLGCLIEEITDEKSVTEVGMVSQEQDWHWAAANTICSSPLLLLLRQHGCSRRAGQAPFTLDVQHWRSTAPSTLRMKGTPN